MEVRRELPAADRASSLPDVTFGIAVAGFTLLPVTVGLSVGLFPVAFALGLWQRRQATQRKEPLDELAASALRLSVVPCVLIAVVLGVLAIAALAPLFVRAFF
jgi:hypothetical protein